MRNSLLFALATLLAALGPSSAAANQYARSAVVAGAPTGDYSDPISAMNALADWCGTPSVENPCLLKVMPGVYPLQSSLLLRPYVDIEGSGADVTKLLGQVKVGPNWPGSVGALRAISVENAGPNVDYSAFYCGLEVQAASIKLEDVALTGRDGAAGLYLESTCTVELDHSEVKATGVGVWVIGIDFNNGDEIGGLSISNSRVSASGGSAATGIYLRGFRTSGVVNSPIRIRDTSITASGSTGSDIGIFNVGNRKTDFSDIDVTADDTAIENGPFQTSGSLARITGSRLLAPVAFNNQALCTAIIIASRVEGTLGGAGFRCAAVLDQGGNPTTCPP